MESTAWLLKKAILCYNKKENKRNRGGDMKLKHILDSVSMEIQGCRCFCKDDDFEVVGVAVWTGGSVEEGKITVFPGDVPTDPVPDGTCCLCLRGWQPCSENWITVEDEKTLWKTFNCIQGYFAKSQEIMVLVKTAVQQQLGLQSLLNQASEVLGNPMLVADPNSNIMAMTDIELEDSAWKRFRELGRLPYHPDRMGMDHGGTGGEAVIVEGIHKKNFFIKCSVCNFKVEIAELQIFSIQREFLPVDLDYTMMLSDTVALDIVGHAVVDRDMHNNSDYLLSELLNGKLNDEETIQKRMQDVGWTLEHVLYLLVVNWGRPGRNIDYRDACMRILTGMVPNGRGIMDGPNMVVLFDQRTELSMESELVRNIQAYLERTELRGVLSLPFTSLENITYRYQQSREILQLNIDLGRQDSFLLAEASMFELLLHEASAHYQLLDYVHPLVRRLLEYDQREDRDLSETLRAYSMTGYSYTRAAERLHTHRNTVIYRMKQIEEILHHEFHDDPFEFQIDLSYRILDYLGFLERGYWAKEQN